MKRFAVFAAAVLLILLPGTSAYGQVTFSVWGGVNVARMVRAPADGRPERTGNAHGHVQRGTLGLAVGVPISGRWSIQLNVSDSPKGRDISDPTQKTTWKHDYFELNLLADLRLDLGEGDRAWLHLLAGPALAYKRSCEVTRVSRGRMESFDCEDETRWIAFSSQDYGAVGGAEAELRMFDRLAFAFGALYTYGLPNISDDPDWGFIEKNRTLTLRGGVRVSIG